MGTSGFSPEPGSEVIKTKAPGRPKGSKNKPKPTPKPIPLPTEAPVPVDTREITDESLLRARAIIGDEIAIVKLRIMEVANSIDVEFDELLAHAGYFQEYGEYWVEGGKFEGSSIPEDFWKHYETYTGKEVASNNRYNFLSCSC